MNRATGCRAEIASGVDGSQNGSGLFSTESVLNLLKLILAGSPLPEVLTIIARLVESRGDGTLCTIWLPDESGRELYCAVGTQPSWIQRSSGTDAYWSERRILWHGCPSQAAGVCRRYLQ